MSNRAILKQCRTIAAALEENIHEALAVWLIAQSANRNKKLIRSLRWPGAQELWDLLFSVWARYVMLVLARVCDSKDTHRASLPKLIDLVDAHGGRAEILSEARSWTPRFPHRADANEKRAEDLLNSAIRRFNRWRQSSKCKEVIDFRHTHLAHDLRLHSKRPKVRVGDIEYGLQVLSGIVRDFQFAIGGQWQDHAHLRQVWEERIEPFWRRLHVGSNFENSRRRKLLAALRSRRTSCRNRH